MRSESLQMFKKKKRKYDVFIFLWLPMCDIHLPPVIHMNMYLILHGQRCAVRWELDRRASEEGVGGEGDGEAKVPSIIDFQKGTSFYFLLQL